MNCGVATITVVYRSCGMATMIIYILQQLSGDGVVLG